MHRLLIFVLACGGSTPARPSDKNVPPNVYDVHEWGLIDQSLVDGSLRLSAPDEAAMRRDPYGGLGLVGYGKPVLYFHVQSGKRFAVRASVSVNGEMRMAEHWPHTFSTATEVRWDFELIDGTCEEPRTYPTPVDPHCTRLGGICEAAELPDYETTDASCLIVDGTQWPLLLYRAAPIEEAARPEERVELPLEVEAELGGTIRIRNRSNVSSPLPMFRLTRSARGMQVTRLDWPTPGSAVSVPRPAADAEGDSGSREATREALVQRGLLESEVDAFMRAWEEALWGSSEGDAGEGTLGLRGTGRGGGGVGYGRIGLGARGIGGLGLAGYDPRSTDVLIYWLPQNVIDELAPLSFEPEPRRVHRAMMVRVGLQ